jgi:3-deoxy-D-manno-octulosonic-acid transferase
MEQACLPEERRPLIWGHAVGLGESQALTGLFRRLANRLPNHQFLITFSTQSAFEAATRIGLPPHCQWRFAPIDVPSVVRRFLTETDPRLLICCELDLWPALLMETSQREIPMLLVNARLNALGWKASPLLRPNYRYLLQRFTHTYAQNMRSAELLMQLGVDTERVSVSGTIKALSPALPCDVSLLESLKRQLAHRWVWVLGSGHAGEHLLAIAAQERLQARGGRIPLLIIAPRFPSQSEEIAAACPTGTPRRGQGALPTDAPIYLADSFGEMGLWYRIADVALVGGSMVPIGGHNPFEPAILGCYCLHGPHVWNFEESYAHLRSVGIAEQVISTESLASALQRRLNKNQPNREDVPLKLEPLEKMLDDLVEHAEKAARKEAQARGPGVSVPHETLPEFGRALPHCRPQNAKQPPG